MIHFSGHCPARKNYVPQFLKQRDINSYCQHFKSVGLNADPDPDPKLYLSPVPDLDPGFCHHTNVEFFRFLGYFTFLKFLCNFWLKKITVTGTHHTSIPKHFWKIAIDKKCKKTIFLSISIFYREELRGNKDQTLITGLFTNFVVTIVTIHKPGFIVYKRKAQKRLKRQVRNRTYLLHTQVWSHHQDHLIVACNMIPVQSVLWILVNMDL
jgi:hypothetical protein